MLRRPQGRVTGAVPGTEAFGEHPEVRRLLRSSGSQRRRSTTPAIREFARRYLGVLPWRLAHRARFLLLVAPVRLVVVGSGAVWTRGRRDRCLHVMIVAFIRHCQADWNAEGLIQGSSDIRLNNTGHR